MAARRTRLATTKATSNGNENDLAAKGNLQPAQGAPSLKASTTTSKIAVETSAAAGSRQAGKVTLGVKSSNVTTTAAVVIANRKRSALTDTTNGAGNKAKNARAISTTAGATASTSGTNKAAFAKTTTVAEGSSTTTTRRYTTRSSTGGTTSLPLLSEDLADGGEDDAEREGEEGQQEDTVMADASLVSAQPLAEQRAIRAIRRSSLNAATFASASTSKSTLSSKTTSGIAVSKSRVGTTSRIEVHGRKPSLAVPAASGIARRKAGPSSAVQIRQRRLEAEARKRAAEEELELAKRAEEEHKAKKARTSEPDEYEYEDEAEEEEEEEEVEVQGRSGAARDEGWENLDDGDEEDPLMVSTYVVEVYEYLRELELTTMPEPDYMLQQGEVTWKMRGILVDWLVEIHTKFRLLPETIFLATNIIDRLLSQSGVSLTKLQLVGITSLFIAAKYEEVMAPSVTNFHYVTDTGYEDDEILRAERYVLGVLDFNLSYPNPINFLRRISKADGYDIQTRTMAKYLMEISIVDHKFMAAPPSLIAAAGSWLARRILDKGYWDANLVHYSGYTEDELKPTAQLMLDYVVRQSSLANPQARMENPLHLAVKPDESEHPNFIKKYAAKKFFKASTSVRKWVEETYAPVRTRNPITRKYESRDVPAIL